MNELRGKIYEKVINMVEQLYIDEFLDKKRDYSPLLVHLTKDDDEFHAKDVLNIILNENILRAYNHYCYFSKALDETKSAPLQNEFRVVCFTETPIDQINVLLMELSGRNFKPKPYGLVFKKAYIREKGGNPVFYATKKIAKPMYDLLYVPYIIGLYSIGFIWMFVSLIQLRLSLHQKRSD
jgi:hypothetical protein